MKNTTTDNFHITFTGTINLNESPIADQTVMDLVTAYFNKFVRDHTLEESLKLINRDELEPVIQELRTQLLEKEVSLNNFHVTTMDAGIARSGDILRYEIDPNLEVPPKKRGLLGRLLGKR